MQSNLARPFDQFILTVGLGLLLVIGTATSTAADLQLAPTGKVVDHERKAVAGAKVVLREWTSYRLHEIPFLTTSELEDILATVSTDEHGQFEFRDVAPRPFRRAWPVTNPWDLIATADGHAMAWHHLEAPDESAIALMLGPQAELSGRVVDDQAKPVAGAEVRVAELAPLGSDARDFTPGENRVDLGLSQAAPKTETDAEGNFRIAGLAPNMRAMLLVAHNDYVRQIVYAATSDQPQPDLVERFYTPGGLQTMRYPVQTGPLAVTLDPGRHLTGVVTLADSGQPCAEALVSVMGEGPGFPSAQTDAEGRFAMYGLRALPYDVYFYAPDDTDYLAARVPIDFAAADKKTVELSVALEKGESVEGSVVGDDGKAVPGVNVYYRPVGEPAAGSGLARAGVTDEEGKFRLVVPIGKGQLVLSGPATGYDVPVWQFQGEPDPGLVVAMDVEPGKAPESVSITVGRGLVVEGVVKDPEGKPLAGAEVRSVDSRGDGSFQQRTTRSDDSGRFVLAGFPIGGAQHIVAFHPDRKLIGRGEAPAAAESKPSRVLALEVNTQPAASATGSVIRQSKPLAGARVTLFHHHTQGDRQFASAAAHAITDANGDYHFDAIEPGQSYYVAFHGQGYTYDQSDPFAAKAGETVELKPIEVLRTDKAVAGTIVDKEGKPVEGAMVTALLTSGRTIPRAFTQEPTGKDGRFAIDGVPDAPLKLMAYLLPPENGEDRRVRFPAEAEAKPGQTDVRIVLDTSEVEVAKEE